MELLTKITQLLKNIVGLLTNRNLIGIINEQLGKLPEPNTNVFFVLSAILLTIIILIFLFWDYLVGLK